MITGKNQIGFELSGKGSDTFRTFNPSKNIENNWEFHEATSEEVNKAIDLAAFAFETYAEIADEQRALFLEAIADEILALGDPLLETYVQESGLPKGRAEGERGRTMNQLRMFASKIRNKAWRNPIIDTGDPERSPMPKPDLRLHQIPLGPIVVFGASNFPLAFSTAGGDTASALAAGCPVIVKSHPMHAGTGEMVATAITKAAKETRMPDGVFSNLNGAGIELGEQLVKHPKVKGVGFTGSLKGGRALFNLAATREEPIPVFAEMGSINPVVITNEALKQRGSDLASQYAASICLGAGQFCTNPGLILAPEGETTNRFASNLADALKAIDSQSMLHPKIHKTFHHGAKVILHEEAVTALLKGEQSVTANLAAASLATVKGKVFLKNRLLHQEVFGPFSLLVTYADEKELLNIIRNLEGQLTATVICEPSDEHRLPAIIKQLKNKVGRIVYNGVPTGVEVSPAMMHGGPYPASTDSRFTSVGGEAINRWLRPICYQDFPKELLPSNLL